jgi:hypothetical protein
MGIKAYVGGELEVSDVPVPLYTIAGVAVCGNMPACAVFRCTRSRITRELDRVRSDKVWHRNQPEQS